MKLSLLVSHVANLVRNKSQGSRANLSLGELKFTQMSYFCEHAKYILTIWLPRILEILPL